MCPRPLDHGEASSTAPSLVKLMSFQMAERSDLSSMVALKEQHIQDLEREKGELLRKLMMPGAQPRFQPAEPARNSAEAGPKAGAGGNVDDSEQTIFNLTEKVSP